MGIKWWVAALSIVGWVVSCSSSDDETGGSSTTASGGGAGGGFATGCCGVELPCPTGQSCSGSSSALADGVGECQPAPSEGSCWNDLDCPTDGICLGQASCVCGDGCTPSATPGTCQPMGEPCCHEEDDCTAGDLCVGAGAFTKGRCVAPLEDGECFGDDDCSAGTCETEQICPCGANCITAPGICSNG
ncbi:MAG: hypothetical protein JRI68_31130 [Deltaproteobacteria bacterium]|nr:hypothetical protein [Deltaproteobacteria bacterium]